MHTATSSHSTPVPAVRAVTLDHPWRWLSAGWLDMTVTPGVSFAYGAVFAAIGFALLFGLRLFDAGYAILPLGLGFALVGPLAAVGLYETSRRMAAGEEPGFAVALRAIGRNPVQIALVGVFLLIAFIAWVRLAMLEFMLFFGSSPPGLGDIAAAILTTDTGFLFLVTGTLTGAVVAAGVFAMAAIAVPMLIDRPDCDAMTAMLTSVDAVRRNWKPMALWAFLIALFTLSGLAMFMIGLVVTLPLIGHASWHAYRDLVEGSD